MKKGTPRSPSLRAYAKTWIVARQARGIVSVADEEARFNRYVLPVLGRFPLEQGAIRPLHVRDWLKRLRSRRSARGELLAPRTVRNIYGLLHRLFEDALADELLETNPCRIKKGELPDKVDKDLAWRSTAIFARSEVEQILSDARIPEDRCVVYTLAACAGLRAGEIGALRWRHYDGSARPLGQLLVAVSFSARTHQEKAVKTNRPRQVPVHPLLESVLTSWREYGWSRLIGRQPRPDDLIIPSRRGYNRGVKLGLRRFHQDLERLGLRCRRLHDLRRTFISLCLSDGARKDVLRWVSHGTSVDVMDLYTTLPWPALCEAVSCLRLVAHAGHVH
jgi:integrase